MRLTVTILSILITFSPAFSQQIAKTDSTVYTFTIKANDGIGFCTPRAIGSRFAVIQSDYPLPLSFIYIEKNKLSTNIKPDKTYLLKGQIWSLNEKVYGCYSAVWEETRLYVTPASFTINIKSASN